MLPVALVICVVAGVSNAGDEPGQYRYADVRASSAGITSEQDRVISATGTVATAVVPWNETLSSNFLSITMLIYPFIDAHAPAGLYGSYAPVEAFFGRLVTSDPPDGYVKWDSR